LKTIFTVIFLSLSLSVFAQSNFYKISVGGGAGITQSFADLKKHDFGLAGYVTADYLFTPFVSLGLEVQAGQINGGDKQTDPNHRQFINTYKSVTANGKLYLGALTDYEHSEFLSAIKGLYAGAGLGLIQNKVSNVRVKPYQDGTTDANSYVFPGENQSKEITVPLNLGINFYLADQNGAYRYVLNFNYQANITLGEGLDGYDDSTIRLVNGRPDIYTYFSVGIRYHLGPIGLSKKTFRRY